MKLDTNKINDLASAMLKGMNSQNDFSFDEMLAILSSARQQLTTAEEEKKKKQEEERKKMLERGEKIAAIATRMLDRQMTPDDLAFAMNCYNESHNLSDIVMTAEDVESIYKNAKKLTDNLESSTSCLDALINGLKALSIDINIPSNKHSTPPKETESTGKCEGKCNSKTKDQAKMNDNTNDDDIIKAFINSLI